MFNIFRRLSTWNLIYDWRFLHPVTSTDETINLFSVIKWKGISFSRFQLFLKVNMNSLKTPASKSCPKTTTLHDRFTWFNNAAQHTRKGWTKSKIEPRDNRVVKVKGRKKSFPCFEIKLEKIEREFRRHQSLWRFNIQREWSSSWHHHHLNFPSSSVVPTHKKLLATSAIASLRPRCLRSNLLIDRTGGRNKYKSGWDEQE